MDADKTVEKEEIELELKKNWSNIYLVIQGFFYFSQGVAFTAIVLLPIFMQNELGIEQDQSIAYQAIIMIPWYIKLLYGILSDNVPIGKLGRRKAYLILSALFGIIGWIWLPTFKKYSSLFLVVGILLSLSVALSDATIDSFSVDITPQSKRGFMQGIGWGGRGLGMSIAGFSLGKLQEIVGWKIVFYLPGALIILASILGLLYKEPAILYKEKPRFETKEYVNELKNKKMWMVTLFMLISGAGISIISVISTFMNQETSLTLEGIGLGVTFFALGQFIGAILFGVLGEYLPFVPTFVTVTLLYDGVLIWLYFLDLAKINLLYFTVVLIGAINGGYEANQMRIAMEYSVSKIGGSLYNWFMSISNVGQISLGAVVIANQAERIGYQNSIQFAHIFLLLAIFPAFFLMKNIKRTKRKEN